MISVDYQDDFIVVMTGFRSAPQWENNAHPHYKRDLMYMGRDAERTGNFFDYSDVIVRKTTQLL